MLTCHALVVGISDYNGTGWPELGTAKADAEAIGEVLENQYGFHVTRLTDRDACRRNILQALDSFMAFGPNDAVLVYFAGHGFYDRQMDEGYWIPYGASRFSGQQPAKEDWLWNTTISRIISASPARHILLIADTCYGGSLFRGEEISAKSAPWYQRAMSVPSRYLITSGNIEPVLDSGIRHSIFAQEILNFLKYNDQPLFSASDLGVAIRQKVSSLTGQMVRMGPLSSPAHAGGEFVFVRKDAPALPTEQLAGSSPEPAVFRTATPLPGPKSRLEQLMDQIAETPQAAADSSFIRPRILACLGPTGPDAEEAALIRGRLSEDLMDIGGCILVEREEFDEILKEVTLSKSPLSDSRVAARIGRLLPASLILFGEIIPSEAGKEVHVRVVDTETSRVLLSASRALDEADPAAAPRQLAGEIMTSVNRARPLLLPATQRTADTLETPWGLFHGARPGETFEIVMREFTDSVSPRETDLGTAVLLSATEERALLKAEWLPSSTNRPDAVWLRAMQSRPVLR
ncbi:MAG: caspase family protein [Kiritimatiellales bacterium]